MDHAQFKCAHEGSATYTPLCFQISTCSLSFSLYPSLSFLSHSFSSIGVLGVIGPTRMAYDRVVPIVDITARILGAALSPKADA